MRDGDFESQLHERLALAERKKRGAIARTIIGLIQSLGLGVVAEGVETERQRAFLARHGCKGYQG